MHTWVNMLRTFTSTADKLKSQTGACYHFAQRGEALFFKAIRKVIIIETRQKTEQQLNSWLSRAACCGWSYSAIITKTNVFAHNRKNVIFRSCNKLGTRSETHYCYSDVKNRWLLFRWLRKNKLINKKQQNHKVVQRCKASCHSSAAPGCYLPRTGINVVPLPVTREGQSSEMSSLF